MKALLVNFSSPEIDRLAAELAARGSLYALVRRYVNKNRWWERALANLPLAGAQYSSTLGRRRPPGGLDGRCVQEAGITSDFAHALVNRLGRRAPRVAADLAKRLQHRSERRIATRGRRLVRHAEVVVGSYHVALPAFRRAKQQGRRTVLNYPIAHHRWQQELYREQATLYPEFAAALPQVSRLEDQSRTLDEEIELADTILVGSQFVRDTFVSVGVAADKLTVIPYGADTERFRPSPARRPAGGAFRVLFVGQIGERKGISHLLRAYDAFRRPSTALHLVGDYVDDPAVYRSLRHLYEHTPNVPQPLLPDIFRAADVFVLPSLVEGMPMVVLEAMACGLPVIVTPSGAAEVVRDGIDGYVVPACDSAAIAERLERLHADTELRLTMAHNARRRAEYWTWARYAKAAADVVLRGVRTTR